MVARQGPEGAADADAGAESLAAIEAGDITPGARRRLNELRDSGGTFTSDLSTADFALCHQLGLRPLAQVMGSSIYQVGYQGVGYGAGFNYAGNYAAGGGFVAELQTLSYAYNEARSRALVRLKHEATAVGADAVVGVDVRMQARDFGDSTSSGVIEFSVIGTAVARDATTAPPAPSTAAPVLTELGVADYVKLVQAGIEPVGIVGASAAFISTYSYVFGGGMLSGGGMGMASANFELTGFTEAVYAARARAMGAIYEQAQALGASGTVGVRIEHRAQRQALGGSNQTGMGVTFHVMGTAIVDSQSAAPPSPETTLNLSA